MTARAFRRGEVRRRVPTLASGAVVAVLGVLLQVSPDAAMAVAATGRPSGNADVGQGGVDPSHLAAKHLPRTPLERPTDPELTIDSVAPSTLTRGSDVTIKGVLDNVGEQTWDNAKVYLDVGYDPATSRATLAEFAASTGGFGDRVVEFGYFDEIGDVDPGSTAAYTLTVPFGKLPISRAPGIYHLGVTVMAGDEIREPVARTDTLVPLLPRRSSEDVEKTGVVTLIPMAAQIRRTASGVFLDDELASKLRFGGQLRNLLDFVAAAPPHTMEVVLDPALRSAVADMADGYTVQSLSEAASGAPGHPGQGAAEAKSWLDDLDVALRRQDLLFMPWGSPDASALGSHQMAGVVSAAVRASQRYAADQKIATTVASWPYAGATSRRGLAVGAIAGAPLRIVSQRSLANLRRQSDGSYPPSQVLVATAAGPTTALVTRTDVAGDSITPDLTGEQLLQDIVAEATVRSLDPEPAATSVVAVPFGWDPGNAVRSNQLKQAYSFPTVRPLTAAAAAQEEAVRYTGPILMPRILPGLSEDVLSSIERYRRKGRIYSELLSDQELALRRFDQALAESGTSLWRHDSATRVAVNDTAAEQAERRIGRVRVTGPTFLALSSGSGRFPLTVSNGLPVPVTVQVVVRAKNPAVRFDPIEQLALDPGQRRDLEATARTNGSGLTAVRIQLTTTSHRPVGTAWTFDIRSTQIGVAIWIVMGIGAAILFGAAGRRIYLRIRQGGLQTRAEPKP